MRAAERQQVLSGHLGKLQRSDAIGRDAATRAVMSALEDDLGLPHALRALEQGARTSDERSRASLRAVAHRILGFV